MVMVLLQVLLEVQLVVVLVRLLAKFGDRGSGLCGTGDVVVVWWWSVMGGADVFQGYLLCLKT